LEPFQEKDKAELEFPESRGGGEGGSNKKKTSVGWGKDILWNNIA